MFKDVDSKVKANLKTFKTYTEKNENLDRLIQSVEDELKAIENQNN